MPDLRLQCTIKPTTALSREGIVNVFHFAVSAWDPTNMADEEALCDDLADLYVTLASNIMPSGVGVVTVKAYDLSDDLPRPIKGEVTKTLTGSGTTGPREVAYCLSFHAERNLPRHRGRVFLGPLRSTLLGERPSATLHAPVNNFGNGLASLGGANVDWSIFSRLDNEMRTVKRFWHDDEWDTMRSRGLQPTSRVSVSTSG